ncbi:histone-lysine N-methyltransferase 2D-like [Cynara cardunculus var. scolymus]|uniref:histone-lysine N-methyltransferase 2D-like n=1 Tax=Cynara cardunculus var. scolymus TaxID=59895 RepID=UPI000D62340C|nr:histone-lysine N-methyltransferase 2D-like [Cynara cardunculus var. scolymus]
MEGFNHFSHPHKLSFHKSLEAAQLVCTGCKFTCTGTPVYSCRPCKFFLHEQCFDAPRSMTHPAHPPHPLSLFPSPTYSSGSFICSSCDQIGSGLCFCCSICEFDLHIHCAYNDPNLKMGSTAPLKQIQLKSHPNHLVHHVPKPPYPSGQCSCDVCGTDCDLDCPLYHCDVCGYDVHLECTDLAETVQREDHEHTVSLLHVNPFQAFDCDVCTGRIEQNHSMYYCSSGCDYGMHVKCVTAKVSVNPPMDELALRVEMLNMRNQTELYKMTMENLTMAASGFHSHRYYYRY